MAVGSIKFDIKVDASQVSTALKSVSQSTKQTTSSFQSVAKANPFSKLTSAVSGFGKSLVKAGTYGLAIKGVSAAVDMVKGSVSGAISRIDTLNNSNRVFQNMGFSAKESKAMMEELSGSIKGLPTSLDGAVKGVQLLASSTGDIGKSQKIFSALNNGILGFGGTTAQVENSVVQLSQAFSNGKVDAETWNSMIDGGLGPALNALAKQMGLTAGQLKSGLSDGSISVEKFQDGLINLNEKGGGGLKSLSTIAKDATAGIGTSIEIMKTAVVRGVAEVIRGFDNFIKSVTGMGLADIFASIGSSMETGLKAIVPLFEKLTPIARIAFETLQTGLSAVVEFLQPVLTKITEFVSGFLKTAEAGTIFGTVVEVIKGYITALVDYWTGIFSGDNSVFNSFVRVFTAIKDVAVPILRDAITFIQSIVTQLTAFWQANGQTIIEAVKNVFSAIASIIEFIMPAVQVVIQTVWENIKSLFQSALNIILGAIKVFSSLFTGDWSGVWAGIKQIAAGAWTFLTAGISNAWNAIRTLTSIVWNGIKTVTVSVWNGIKSAISSAINGAKSIVSSVVNGIKSTVSNVFNGIKSIATSVWNGIKSAITRPIEAAKNTVLNIVERIKSAFNFRIKFPPISIPHIPLPHFSISGSFNPLKGKIPSIGIDWYATGGIFTGPSVVGVGEAGDEAVVPLSNKSRMAPFAKAVSDFMKDEQQQQPTETKGLKQPIIIDNHLHINDREFARVTTAAITEEQNKRTSSSNRRGGKRI